MSNDQKSNPEFHLNIASDIGPRHEEYVIYMNNSDGSIPLVSPGSRGVWTLPKELIWDLGLEPEILLHFPYNAPYRVYDAQCKALLDNEPLMDMLRATKFDAAIVDLGKLLFR